MPPNGLRLSGERSGAERSESGAAACSATAYLTPAATRGAGAPRNRPSVLRSSSTSGQWIPYPAPMICQFSRCSGVASRSLGYQTRGTVMVRPSARSTLSVSSEKWTSRTASPGLGSEGVIPRLQQCSPVLGNQPFNCPQLTWAEAEIPRQGHWLKPELGRGLVSVDVDMRRLAKIMTHKVYWARPAEKNRRHLNSVTPNPERKVNFTATGSKAEDIHRRSYLAASDDDLASALNGAAQLVRAASLKATLAAQRAAHQRRARASPLHARVRPRRLDSHLPPTRLASAAIASACCAGIRKAVTRRSELVGAGGLRVGSPAEDEYRSA